VTQPKPTTPTDDVVTALQAIRLEAIGAANAYLGAGLRSLTNIDPARLLMLADTIAAYITDGTIPPPTCTCQLVDVSTGVTPEYVRGRADGCTIHEDPAVHAAKEAARHA